MFTFSHTFKLHEPPTCPYYASGRIYLDYRPTLNQHTKGIKQPYNTKGTFLAINHPHQNQSPDFAAPLSLPPNHSVPLLRNRPRLVLLRISRVTHIHRYQNPNNHNMSCTAIISPPFLTLSLELRDLPNTKFTNPPARSTTDITEFWIKAAMDATLWKRVSKMERMAERMESIREERESVRPAMMVLGCCG